MVQDIIVGVLIIGSLSYIGFRIFKTVTKKKCDDKNCGCK